MLRHGRILLAIALVIGIVLTSGILWQRHKVETDSNEVALFMDANEILLRSRLKSIDLEYYLRELNVAGLKAITLPVTAFRDLQDRGDIVVLSGLDATTATAKIGARPPVSGETIIVVRDRTLIEAVFKAVPITDLEAIPTITDNLIYVPSDVT
ncbi:MAG: hypothetical protein Q8N36_04630, partial [bacterium]|nr:hypothetical protein [bacterium]